ncbi:chemotaxis protein [Clostridium gelidum]|uniref:Chemotaxis protein n=1 Tax=Clostridium gelidum TaxID=704125 RepID=A0ABM7SZ28_9CLOT|nr:methyl-accepting chemotaxis protein [Clostridium gelidum]BCZ44927.1 chemotaxis protein [Clostridium gelidum]
MSIKKKLIVALLSASITPLIIFIAISFYFSQNIAAKNAMDDNLKRTELVQEKISALINEHLHGIEMVAKNQSIQSYDQEGIKNVLSYNLKIYKSFDSYVVTKPDGNQLIKVPEGKLANAANRNFFQIAMKGNDEVVSEILESNTTGNLITVLATPIRDPQSGDVTGVLQGTIQLTMLNDFVKDLSENNVNVYILDSEGKLLADANKALGKLEDRDDLSDYDFVKGGLNGNKGSVKVKKDGTDMLVSYARDPKTGWLICAEKPYNLVIKDSVKSSVFTSLIGLALLAFTSIVVYIFIKRGIKPIQMLVSVADSISKGDLSIKNINVKSKDEIGVLSRSFEKMVGNLQELIDNIKVHTVQVSESSRELAEVCDQQSQASTTTAENVNEIADGTLKVNLSIDKITLNIDNLKSRINDVRQKSNTVTMVVDKASNYSESGSKALSQINLSMKNIQESVNNIAKVLDKLGEHSKAIGEITEVIKGISEQTNLLALNAAIEAARAGEQGKGFAVVAEEVRTLAEQSGIAAENVSNLINGMQSETKNVSVVMDKGLNEVDSGSKIIDEANRYFDLIFNSIQEISVNIKEVDESIESMEGDGKEISLNIKTMAELSNNVSAGAQTISATTEEQVASIEEMTASAAELGEMSESLEKLANRFKIK